MAFSNPHVRYSQGTALTRAVKSQAKPHIINSKKPEFAIWMHVAQHVQSYTESRRLQYDGRCNNEVQHSFTVRGKHLTKGNRQRQQWKKGKRPEQSSTRTIQPRDTLHATGMPESANEPMGYHTFGPSHLPPQGHRKLIEGATG